MSVSFLLAITFLLQPSDIGFAGAFTANQARRHSFESATNIFSSDGGVSEKDEINNAKTSSMTSVKFSGETALITDTVAVDKNKALHDFFALPGTPSLLLRGLKNNEVNELQNIDAELFKKYERNCKLWNVTPATPDDRIFDVTTSGIQFPGLRVRSVVTIGVKTICTTGYPSYQLVLFRDATFATGNRLCVWFFNKATGNGKSNEDDPSPDTEQSTFNVNRVSVVSKEDGMVSFKSQAELSLQLKFPSFLINAIPGLTKEKMETSGSKSIQKALEDDVPPALEGFRQGYLRWLES